MPEEIFSNILAEEEPETQEDQDEENPNRPDLSLDMKTSGNKPEDLSERDNDAHPARTAKEVREKLTKDFGEDPQIIKQSIEELLASPRPIEELREKILKVNEEMIGGKEVEIGRNGRKIHLTETEIDKKIEPLIIGLWRWNVITLQSCGGHRIPKGFESPYPFVIFAKEHEGLVRKILESYDHAKEWKIKIDEVQDKNLVLHPKLKESKNEFLNVWSLMIKFAAYQKEAKRFARWLQKIPDDYFITKQKKS